MTVAGTVDSPPAWITGWRLIAIAVGTSLSLFMIQIESSITSTAITAITDDLGGFDRSSWVFTAYLATYSGFPIFFSKLSDIVGRKQVMLGCLALFVVFSGACGAAQSLTQLIMFRWIKGIGAAGIVAIGTLYGFELRPPEKWPGYSAFIMLAMAVSLAIAPVIGAAFTQVGQWRWCFLMNVPVGAVTIFILLFSMPNKLALEPAAHLPGSDSFVLTLKNLRRLDCPGIVMLMGASVLLMTALQQAAEGISFASPTVLTLLILSPFFLVGFLFWQRFLTSKPHKIAPLLGWNLLTNRVYMAMAANAWLSGLIFTVSIVQIPQRFMLVNSLSAIDAGVRLLPFAAVMAFTSVITSILASKAKIPGVNVLFFGCCLGVAGVVGLSLASTQPTIEARQYGFQVLTGAAVGIFNIMLILLTPYVVERKDLAVANGAITQARVLGGSLGLSIITCATSPSLRTNLMQVVTPVEADLILDRTETILELPPVIQALVRPMFGEMYNLQMTIAIGIAAAQFLATLLQWQRKPIVLKG